tara:strand:+ start:2735 stop:3304 length:570 start_codon:yes stop_codon:yes gene_type:complete
MSFKYKILKNFLSQGEVELLNCWIEIYHRNNQKHFDWKMSPNADGYAYGDPITDAILLKSTNKIEKEIDRALLPTYSFMRVTTKFGDLYKHKDRESCELSVTIHIGSDGTDWPIYIDGKKIDLQKGDAIVYRGADYFHWREEFLGDWSANIFLHYVFADGNFTEHYKDKRKSFGLFKTLEEKLNEIHSK